MDHNVLITRVSSAMQRWRAIRSDDISSCSCMQLVSHMFAPRLRWPRDRDPDECNLQACFATCSLAFICVFLPWQIPRNNIETPSLLGRSQTTQVRCLCVAQVWGTRARTSLIAICMYLAFHDVPAHRELQPQRLAIGLREEAPLPNVDGI